MGAGLERENPCPVNPDWLAQIRWRRGLVRQPDIAAKPHCLCQRTSRNGFESSPATVEVGSADLFNYPFVHLTGHGNVVFSPAEVQNLRTYLCGGGFLHIDDNYGLDKFIRREMKKVFPETDFVELPASHPVFKQAFDFSATGLPKIHEHDNKRPQAFALFHEGRMVCLYTYECDLGDGWESPEVHGDKEETHRKALEMGVDILQFVFMQ